MAVYKVSYVITGSDHPGGILNLEQKPQEGEKLIIGDTILEILESVELMPPRGDFFYFHVTCKVIKR